MAIPLINNESLKKFILGVKISQERKDFLLSKLPEMDFEERKALFEALTKIHLLDLEEEKAIARIKKFWEK
jgi:hypothetical protein